MSRGSRGNWHVACAGDPLRGERLGTWLQSVVSAPAACTQADQSPVRSVTHASSSPIKVHFCMLVPVRCEKKKKNDRYTLGLFKMYRDDDRS